MSSRSPLEKERQKYIPKLPNILEKLSDIHFKEMNFSPPETDKDEIESLFPKTYAKPLLKLEKSNKSMVFSEKKVGVVFSGGQASGGHNVIVGIYDALNRLHSNSKLIGFLNGPSGIIDEKYIEIDSSLTSKYKNLGGFDMIGSGRTKIETEKQLKKSLQTVKNLNLDGLVIIGGDDSNTNAAVLAEYFEGNNLKVSVVGVPKTIDGDLKNKYIEVSFGFDTACKVYAEMLGNLLTDALSAKKYYHFVKLMGRSASHIALECAHQTHPNITIIGEEVFQKNQTLGDITNYIASIISKRALANKNYGVILIPEGLIEFIPEVGQLIKELNNSLAENPNSPIDNLSKDSKGLFNSLPKEIQDQLLLDRDPHGNVQVAKINTEMLLINTVNNELNKRKEKGLYSGKFNTQPHYFGYEGRSAYPSNFDANYCYSLGYGAALIIQHEETGYMVGINNLVESAENWSITGIPFTSMLNLEQRHGKLKPVIKKALINLNSTAFKNFEKQRDFWALEDDYLSPGPTQYSGSDEVTNATTLTLRFDSSTR